MQNVLYLTPKEQELFQGLSENLKEGWVVEEQEILQYEDPADLVMRYQIADFSDPSLVAVADRLQNASGGEDVVSVLQHVDIQSMSQEQMAELFFVLGTKIVGYIISYLLNEIQDDEDIEGVEGMTLIRRMLIEANSE